MIQTNGASPSFGNYNGGTTDHEEGYSKLTGQGNPTQDPQITKISDDIKKLMDDFGKLLHDEQYLEDHPGDDNAPHQAAADAQAVHDDTTNLENDVKGYTDSVTANLNSWINDNQPSKPVIR